MDSPLNSLLNRSCFVAHDFNFVQFKMDVCFCFNKDNNLIGIIKTMDKNRVIIEFDNPRVWRHNLPVISVNF
jgi:hypothetical protein